MSVYPIVGHDAEVAAWVASGLHHSRGYGNCKAIGWAEGDKLLAGTVYHNWSPEAGVIELTTYAESPRWLTRETLRHLFGYPFDVIECQMIVLRVSEHNERMASIARRFGFTEIRIPRLRGVYEDELIFTLTDDQWRGLSSRWIRRNPTGQA